MSKIWDEYFDWDGESSKNGKNKNNILFLRELISVLDPAEVAELVKRLTQSVEDLQLKVTSLDDDIENLKPRVSTLEQNVNSLEIEKQPMITSLNAGERIKITGSGTELKITADDQLPDLTPYVKKEDYEVFVDTITKRVNKTYNLASDNKVQIDILNTYKPNKIVIDTNFETGNDINNKIKQLLKSGTIIFMQLKGQYVGFSNRAEAGFLFLGTKMTTGSGDLSLGNTSGGATPDLTGASEANEGFGTVWTTGWSDNETNQYFDGNRWKLRNNGIHEAQMIKPDYCVIYYWNLEGNND